MQAVLVTKDLMFSSRVQALAKKNDLPLKVVSSLQALSSAMESNATQLVAVDLETRGVSTAQWLESIEKVQGSQPKTIAYAPHGQVQKIKEAREAGFDQVLTRGQFDSQIGEILQDSVNR